MSIFLTFSLTFGRINFSNIKCAPPNQASFKGDKCWMLVAASKNFIEAAQFCRSFNGNLTSIHSSFDNIYLADIAQQYFTLDFYYIGGSNLEDKKTWSWLDESAMDFANWGNYEPIDGILNNCLVAAVGHGIWHTHDCTKKSSFVCDVPEDHSTTTFRPNLNVTMTTPTTMLNNNETTFTSTTMQSNLNTTTKMANTVPLTTTTPNSVKTTKNGTIPPPDAETTPMPFKKCSDAWTFYNITGFCYKVFHNATWPNAETFCNSQNATLASIHSLEENTFITNMIPFKSDSHQNGPQNWAWIGLFTHTHQNNWNWTDHTSFDFSSWAPGRPGYPRFAHCGIIWNGPVVGAPFGSWADGQCNSICGYYICKKLTL